MLSSCAGIGGFLQKDHDLRIGGQTLPKGNCRAQFSVLTQVVINHVEPAIADRFAPDSHNIGARFCQKTLSIQLR
jgi:hypothetical protein